MKAKMFVFTVVQFAFFTTLLSSCGGGGGGESAPNCQLVADGGSPNLLRVHNTLGSGLSWVFVGSLPFGADMKPNECVLVSLSDGSYTIDLTQCNIGDAACTSTFGATQQVDFSVSGGETYSVDVGSLF